VAILAFGSVAGAGIISATAADDGDGVFTCIPVTVTQEAAPELTLTIDGVHNLWEPGHVLGVFTTDTEEDPTVKMLNSIENDTGFTWTDYHIKITMNKDFSIGAIANSLAPSNWITTITQPTQVGSSWIGTIDYFAGTPVLVGESFDFGYSLSFLGSAQYCLEMVPTPEPATMGLLLIGGLAVLRRRRNK